MNIQEALVKYRTMIGMVAHAGSALLLLNIFPAGNSVPGIQQIKFSYVAIGALALSFYLYNRFPVPQRKRQMPPIPSAYEHFGPNPYAQPQMSPQEIQRRAYEAQSRAPQPPSEQLRRPKYDASYEYTHAPAKFPAPEVEKPKKSDVPDISLNVKSFAETNKEKAQFVEAVQKTNTKITSPPSVDEQFP